MDSIQIRKALPDDAFQIATVHVKMWQHAYKGQIPDSYLNSLSIKERTKGWRNQIENPDEGVHTFVVEMDGKVVGWCTAGKSRDEDAPRGTGELYGIYIHPDYAGGGLGSQLMEHALDVLRKDGYKKTTLWALDTNKKAREGYGYKGWKVEGKKKSEPRDNFTLNETRYIIDL